MDPHAPEELTDRVARLEAQVAWLLQQRPALADPVKPAPPSQSRLAPPPPAPRQESSPVAWIAGIAAAIFLLGAVFFLRWAIQEGWLGPEWRFALGLLAGLGLSAFAGKQLLGDSRRLGIALLLAGLGVLQFTFWAGAQEYHFYAAPFGLGAMALLTLLAGGLAARSRSGGALTVSLVSGLATPLVFSQGGHHEVALALYLAVLMAAALAVPFLTRTGASWHGARWTALLGVWLLLLPVCLGAQKGDAPLVAGLLLLHLSLAGLWAWLPGHPEKPGTPTVLWLIASLLATAYGWRLWQHLGLAPEAFALPVLGAAALNLSLIAPLRRRMKSRRADWGLLALAAGHFALAVPVALAWRWVGPVWGLFAGSLAWAALRAEDSRFAEEATALRWLAAALALITTLRWAFHGLDGVFFSGGPRVPFFSPAFAEGALAATAWWLLTRRGGPLGLASFLALEVTANVTVALEAARLVRWLQEPAPAGHELSRAPSIAMTLVWALSGAWQWMRGLDQRDEARRALMMAGYVWMGLASLKLMVFDLDRATTPLRALAFLGVGGIGMAAAILANRARKREPS
jgi:uncharacterized membrane protein